MRFYYNNLADIATVTASTANSSYPASNVQVHLITKLYKTLGTQATEALVFDMGSAVPVTACILYATNFDGTETNCKIQGNSADSWTSPAFSEDLTADGTTLSATFASQTYRYWRVVFTKANATDIRSIGRVFIGTYVDTQEPDWGGFKRTIDETTIIGQSLGGQEYAYRKDQRYILELDFSILPKTDYDNLVTVLTSCGLHKPLFVQLTAHTDIDALYYARLGSHSAQKVSGILGSGLAWDVSLTLRQQI
jgi:hypothetical protein